AGMPDEAHELYVVTLFLEHVPDQARAEALVPALAAALPTARYFRSDPTDTDYGQPPPRFAPTPDSRWRSLFDDADFERHLDRLDGEQQPDGGWPISWDPLGESARWDARGVVTLEAMRTLRAYGRM